MPLGAFRFSNNQKTALFLDEYRAEARRGLEMNGGRVYGRWKSFRLRKFRRLILSSKKRYWRHVSSRYRPGGLFTGCADLGRWCELSCLEWKAMSQQLPIGVLLPTFNVMDRIGPHLEQMRPWLPSVKEVIVVESVIRPTGPLNLSRNICAILACAFSAIRRGCITAGIMVSGRSQRRLPTSRPSAKRDHGIWPATSGRNGENVGGGRRAEPAQVF